MLGLIIYVYTRYAFYGYLLYTGTNYIDDYVYIHLPLRTNNSKHQCDMLTIFEI